MDFLEKKSPLNYLLIGIFPINEMQSDFFLIKLLKIKKYPLYSLLISIYLEK